MAINLTGIMNPYQVYSGYCGAFGASAAANTWYCMDTLDWSNTGNGKMLFVQISWANLNTAYGYTVSVNALVPTVGPNTSGNYCDAIHFIRGSAGIDDDFNGIPLWYGTHVSTTNLTVQMYMSKDYNDTQTYPDLSLWIRTNYAVSSSAPTMQIYRLIG